MQGQDDLGLRGGGDGDGGGELGLTVNGLERGGRRRRGRGQRQRVGRGRQLGSAVAANVAVAAATGPLMGRPAVHPLPPRPQLQLHAARYQPGGD